MIRLIKQIASSANIVKCEYF